MVGLSEACSGSSDPVTIIVNFPPDAEITATDNLLETISGASAYQWYFNSNPIAGANSNSYLAEVSGNYQVEVTGINGCTGLSEIYYHLAIAIEDNNFGHFIVFPNPAHDKLIIQSANDWTEGLTIRIIDMNGRIVYLTDIEQTRTDQTIELNIMHLRPGEYYLQIMHDEDFKFYLINKQ